MGNKILPVLSLTACLACVADRRVDEPEAGAVSDLPRGERGGFPGTVWSVIEPEPDRWDRAELQAAVSLADSLGSGALLVIDDGGVVALTGAIGEAYQIASMRKSLLSVLIGIAVDREQLDLGATLGALGIDDLPPALSPLERTATVRNLITARSGIYHEAAYEPASMKRDRPARGSHAPGEFWFYNNWDFNALGTIYHRATGTDAFEGFAREIAAPLELEDYALEGQQWIADAATEHPAYVFRMSARDIARVGLLMLRGGVWDDRRIVSADWIRESTAPHAEGWYGTGYGYMWWVANGGLHYEAIRLPDDAFIGRGAGHHQVLVVPSLDLVAVHLAETNRPSPARWVDEDDVAAMFGLILEARGFDTAW